MRYLVYLTLILFLVVCEGLKCRSENDAKTQEEFEDVVRNCLRMDESDYNMNSNRRRGGNRNSNRNNNNNGNNWSNRDQNNNRNQNNRGRGNNNDDDYNRNDQNKRGYGNDQGRRYQSGRHNNNDDYDYEDDKWSSGDNSGRRNQQKGDNSRNHGRGDNDDNYHSIYHDGYGSQGNKGYKGGYQNNYNSGSGFQSFNTTSKNNIGSPLENVDPCIIHCMFRQMKMVNNESYLERSTVINVLTRRIRDPELKEFIQDSVQECFENVDRENEGRCEYSKSFALCLEEKGKSNCDDWDLSSRQGKKNGRNNNQGNIFQNSPSRG